MAMTTRSMRILILEDIATDAELAVRELQKAGMECTTIRVEKLDEFIDALTSFLPDVIIADYSLPTLNALDALRAMKRQHFAIPFILCTGTQSEEVAVRCMKEGAVDYILKTSLKRLPTAVDNAIAKRSAEKETEAARTALQRSEEQHRLIAEHTHDLIGLYDRDLRIHFVSPSVRELLGYDPKQLKGTSLLDYVHSDDRAKVKNTLQQSLVLKDVRPLEFKMKHQSGEWKEFESAGSWIYNADGVPENLVIISRDMTERRNLEAQLRQAQKMEGLGTLAGGIAHDFNNLLGIVLGHTYLLRQFDTEGTLQRHIDAIGTTVERGSNLVRQLLAFARKSETNFSPVNLNSLVEDLTKILGETFPTNIQITTNLAAKTEKVVADGNQLHQALLNLCVNARDAMPDGGTLTIRTRTVQRVPLDSKQHMENTRPYLCLSVQDTGEGMDETTKARIFEPFFTTKEHGKGTGLGLSTVYGIINNHGGTIEVESEKDKGTTFSLYFPLIVSSPQGGAVPLDKKSSVRGNNETILIVEDEVMLLDLASSILQSHGYRVLRAESGLDAVRMYQTYAGEISVVLSDMGLPGLGGLQAFEQMKMINPNLVAVFATGYLDDISKESLAQAGVVGFLQKPYLPNEILTVVHNAVHLARTHTIHE